MKKETCGEKVVVADLNHCQTTKFCSARCEKQESNFVCGSDGNLYRNQCEMKKAKCGHHIYQVPLSECLSVFQWSGCGRVCPPALEPVCGSDDKTYLNTCFMEQESCRARSLGVSTRSMLDHVDKSGRKEPGITCTRSRFTLNQCVKIIYII